MKTGVALLNFGEPSEPDRELVVEYLTRIFLNNADLEEYEGEAAARERSRQLAERRAPGLIEEYEEIGGSPLNPQSRAQAEALGAELADRGHDVETYVGFQFMEPLIDDAANAAREDGIDRLVGLPIYPLCGPSTTVAALDDLQTAVEAADDWAPDFHGVSGWHRHPQYTRLRVDAIRNYVDEHGLDLDEADTTLLFSAHGTPQHYVEEGSRYVEYVEEWCETVAAMLGVEEYALGYQNHENRDIPWTEPDVEDVVEEIDAERVVVDPVSFAHEQSETLAELDHDLREDAEDAGLEFYRVPVPHDDPRLAEALADLVEPFLAGFEPGYYQLRQCECRPAENTVCLNAPRR